MTISATSVLASMWASTCRPAADRVISQVGSWVRSAVRRAARAVALANGPQVSVVAAGPDQLGESELVDDGRAGARRAAGEQQPAPAGRGEQPADAEGGREGLGVLGRWLASRRARDRVVLGTKVGALPDPPGAAWPEFAEGLSEKVVRAQAEASMCRLGVEHLDVYHAHIEDRRVPLADTVATFASLVTDGLVRVAGLSNHAAREIAKAQGMPGFGCVQQRHTYLRPRPGAEFGVNPHISEELLDYAREEPALEVLGYSALLSGAYTRPDRALPAQYEHPDSHQRLAVLAEVAGELGATRNQVVLAWLLRGNPQVLPVLGVSSVEQFDECLGALELELDEEMRGRLDCV